MAAELNLILLGPPGAGKGTQASRLQDEFDLPYIATGDMLREARDQDTELGREAKGYMDAGELVPDELIVAVVKDRINQDDAADGFILDGFPRTVPQAEALDEQIAALNRRLTAVLLVEVADDDLVRRISGRRIAPSTKRVYHVEYDPPEQEGVDDETGEELVQREDDHPDKVRRRLEVYHEQTEPLVEYYDRQSLLHRFDGTRNPPEVYEHIRKTLTTLRMEAEI